MSTLVFVSDSVQHVFGVSTLACGSASQEIQIAELEAQLSARDRDCDLMRERMEEMVIENENGRKSEERKEEDDGHEFCCFVSVRLVV